MMIETYEVTSAFYANEANDAILLVTSNEGDVLIPQDRTQVWEAVMSSGLEIGPYQIDESVVVQRYEHAVQAHMDAAASAAGYDDIKTAVTYADEPAVAKFQQEGAAFRAWRSLCWAYCYEQLAAVQAGQRSQPTVEELIGELPTLLLPV